nr:PREDICTED: glutathione S-transferase 1-1-like [Linepithema humile]XP_012215006.1 PREDICTED: glutathione S-transferase 1-1-like [Linepithema humile]
MQLYYFPVSSPCRAVLLTAEAIGLEMELIELNISVGEHMTPEYGELNPQRTIPFLVDDDLKISESRAIMAYLVDQYGENDALYPRNPEARGIIDQRLYFDIDTLFASIFHYYLVVLRREADTYNQAQYEILTDAFKILDTFLEGQDYVAGANMTIADFALVASVTTALACGFNVEEYANVTNWLERMQTSAPGYEKANGEPIEMFKQFVEASLSNEEEGEKEEDEEEGEKDEEEGEKEEEEENE